MTLQPDGLVGVQAIEYLDIYTWQAPPQEIIEPINNPVAYFAVKAPTGITFTDAGSSSTGRSFLTWDEPTDYPNHQYRIRIVDSSSNKLTNKIVDQEFVDLNYLPVGSNYVASVSAINSINEESSAATLTFSVSTPPVATADVKDDADAH
jgi:predicted phage tail protein